MKDKKSVILRYVIATAIGAAIAVFVLYTQNFQSIADLAKKYKILADAFTIPGVLLIMMGALVWVSTEGFFDAITYAFKQFSGLFIPSIGRKYKHVKYYDYKMERQDKRIQGYSFLFFVGLFFMVIAIVFIILFNSVYVPKA